MKFRKKPVVIDAIQYVDSNLPLIDFVQSFGVYPSDVLDIRDGYLTVKTLEGSMRISPYDYLIRGINGEYYPCKPDIFKKTYDLIEDATVEELKQFSKNNFQ